MVYNDPQEALGAVGSSHLGPASSFQCTAAADPYHRAIFWGQGSRRGWQPPSSWQWPGLGPRHPPSHPRLCPHQSCHPRCAAGKQRGGAEHLLGRGIHSFPSCPRPWACFPHRGSASLPHPGWTFLRWSIGHLLSLLGSGGTSLSLSGNYPCHVLWPKQERNSLTLGPFPLPGLFHLICGDLFIDMNELFLEFLILGLSAVMVYTESTLKLALIFLRFFFFCKRSVTDHSRFPPRHRRKTSKKTGYLLCKVTQEEKWHFRVASSPLMHQLNDDLWSPSGRTYNAEWQESPFRMWFILTAHDFWIC